MGQSNVARTVFVTTLVILVGIAVTALALHREGLLNDLLTADILSLLSDVLQLFGISSEKENEGQNEKKADCTAFAYSEPDCTSGLISGTAFVYPTEDLKHETNQEFYKRCGIKHSIQRNCADVNAVPHPYTPAVHTPLTPAVGTQHTPALSSPSVYQVPQTVSEVVPSTRKGNDNISEPPVPLPVRVPVPAPVQAPEQAPVQAPVKSPVPAPVKAPVSAPVKAPVAAPVKAPV